MRRKIALSMAIQSRTCPPISLQDIEPELFKKHLAKCPYCATTISDMKEVEALSTLAALIMPPMGALKDAPIKVGNIHITGDIHSGWNHAKHIFYNPISVLVLKIHQYNGQDLVDVAQVYDDINLAATGDYILNDHHFVECWNTYTLPAFMLKYYMYQIDVDDMQNIIAAIKNEDCKYRVIPAPMTYPIDPRATFRKTEADVAHYFSTKYSDYY